MKTKIGSPKLERRPKNQKDKKKPVIIPSRHNRRQNQQGQFLSRGTVHKKNETRFEWRQKVKEVQDNL